MSSLLVGHDALDDRRGSMKSFRFRSHYKDSIAVQMKRNYVNDDDEHASNPRLQEFLVRHRDGDVERLAPKERNRLTLLRPSKSILFNPNSSRRCANEAVESRRRIAFREVTVREYDMTLGDHPNCSYGPPVSLGWRYVEYAPLGVDEYEYHHALRRPLRLLGLNYYRRMEILGGHDVKELKETTREVARTKMRRTITRTLSPCWMLFYVSESTVRKLKRGLKKDKPVKQWDPEDELDWSVRGTKRSILRRSTEIEDQW